MSKTFQYCVFAKIFYEKYIEILRVALISISGFPKNKFKFSMFSFSTAKCNAVLLTSILYLYYFFFKFFCIQLPKNNL